MNTRRRIAAAALLAALAGCRSPAAPAPPAAPVAAPTPAPVQPEPTPPAAPPKDILRQAVLVDAGRPAALTCQLYANQQYIVYAAAMDEQDGAKPVLLVRDPRGQELGRNEIFRNELFAAVPLRPSQDQVVQIEVDTAPGSRGSISVRVQAAGELAPGQAVSGVLGDYQTFHFYSVPLTAGERYEAVTDQLGEGVDTLLSLHRPQDLLIIAENDDAWPEQVASQLLWQAHESGRYLLVVTSWSQSGIGAYTIRLERIG